MLPQPILNMRQNNNFFLKKKGKIAIFVSLKETKRVSGLFLNFMNCWQLKSRCISSRNQYLLIFVASKHVYEHVTKIKEKEVMCIETILFLIQHLVEHMFYICLHVQRTWIANSYKVSHQNARCDFPPFFHDLFIILL